MTKFTKRQKDLRKAIAKADVETAPHVRTLVNGFHFDCDDFNEASPIFDEFSETHNIVPFMTLSSGPITKRVGFVCIGKLGYLDTLWMEFCTGLNLILPLGADNPQFFFRADVHVKVNNDTERLRSIFTKDKEAEGKTFAPFQFKPRVLIDEADTAWLNRVFNNTSLAAFAANQNIVGTIQ